MKVARVEKLTVDYCSVSVIIPAFNRGPKIAKAIDSVLRQTRPADEIIVVDDGSSDATGEWVRTHYPSVRMTRIQHSGPSTARNVGAMVANGKILVFFDSDDEMLPHAIETLLEELRDFPQARAAYADHTLTDYRTGQYFSNHYQAQASFNRLRNISAIQTKGDTQLYGKDLYDALLRGNLLGQPWAIYRNEFLELKGFAPELNTCACDDWELYLRITRTFTIALSNRVISNHYFEKEGKHASLSPHSEEMKVKAFRRHLALLGLRDPRASLILLHRLGLHYKTMGDQAKKSSLRRAWQLYLRSFFIWPFDLVVAGRMVLWLGQMCIRRQ